MFTKSQIMKQGNYKTGEIAKMLGISIPTVIRYCDQNIIKHVKNQYGHRRIEASDFFDYLLSIGQGIDDSEQNKHDVIYARVSTHKQAECGDLDRQIETVKLFAINYNVRNLLIKKDIGSGLNDNRKNLKSLIDLIQQGKVNRVFINYKDRLTRFGFNYIKQICDFHQVEIIVVSNMKDRKSESEELAEDIIALIHSFSGKLYGLRHKIKKELGEDEKES